MKDKCFYDDIKGLNDYIEAIEKNAAKLEDKIDELKVENKELTDELNDQIDETDYYRSLAISKDKPKAIKAIDYTKQIKGQ